MDPMQQILLIALCVVAIRVLLAAIATRRGWGWRPWAVIASEILISMAIPGIEALVGMVSLITLIVMCFKKRKPKLITNGGDL